MRNTGSDTILPPQREIHELAVSKGFWSTPADKSMMTKLALIHSEVSEAVEAVKKGIGDGEDGCLGEELADTIIRILDLAEFAKIDIQFHVWRKHERNKHRAHRHGDAAEYK